MYWNIIWIFLIVSAVCCAIGFKKFVYFLSVGYGFAVAGLGIAYLVTSFIRGTWDIIGIVQCVLFMVYGARLSGFLLAREIKNASYRNVLKNEAKGEKKIPIFVSITIWLSVTILYVAQTCPVFFRAENGAIWQIGGEFELKNVLMPVIGIVVSIIGITLEALADHQKTAQKKENPHMVATKGLYKMVRCPNYLGEILFWTGVLLSGVTTLDGVGQWITAVLGWICIVYVMINGAQRLDKRQEGHYGTNEEYRAYADHTPIILPLIPISHIGKGYKGETKKKEK